MLTPRQNMIETMKRDGKPDRLLNQYEAFGFAFGNPLINYIRGNMYPGMEPTTDAWGTPMVWPAHVPGAMPHITEANKPIPDVTCWRDFVKVPDLIANCSADEMWEPYIQNFDKLDKEQKLATAMVSTGVFERMHYLMGFEDTLCNFMLEPEAMEDLACAIGEYRLKGFKLIYEHCKPEVLLSHDDWGDKQNLFIQPELWRQFIKPQYEKGYGYMHDKGVIILHHADSICEPIIEDMVDIHIDIWQGVLPQNDIVKLQKQLDGRMVLMGGIDAAIVDRENATEEEIRAEVRRACDTYAPGGHFVPCITYGFPGCIYKHVDPIISDEINRYNKEHFGI